MTTPNVSISVPPDLAADIEQKAKSMGLTVVLYLRLMAGTMEGKLDSQAMDAIRFAFTKHSDSLRKLAQ
ncbi:MAG: hypothetical protein JNM86_05255 [Phycisphaerae bacterium]|nr:hypothetical protein [Phycisphaerae bacterium]MBN8598080.1 hypothetical protein [Planctomycetota bacterium]